MADLPWLRAVALAGAALALGVGLRAETAGELVTVRSVRFWSLGQTTRVAIELSGETKYRYDRLHNPERLFLDVLESKSAVGAKSLQVIRVGDRLVKQVRVGQKDPRTTRVVLDLEGPAEHEISQLANPNRIIVEVRAPGGGGEPQVTRSRTGAEKIEAGRARAEEGREEAGGREQAAQERPAPEKREVAKADRPREAQPKPMATKPAETKQAERKPAETKPAERTPSEPKPAATKAAEITPAGTKPAERKPVEPRPAETKAAETKPAGMTLAEAKPVEAAPAASAAGAVSAPDSGAAKRERAAGEIAPSENLPPPKAARVPSSGARSLTRALGLKIGRVVLDPGHGGHDHGTTGPTGLTEKELVLDVALRLGALIEQRLGSEVVYTRDTDRFIPLEERTALANDRRADLFLSIHANSTPLKSISGAEVYYLNFSTSRESLDVAARENAGHGKSIFELRELIQKIALKDKLEESREFATRVQTSLASTWTKMNPTARNRGVKKAPFVVLIGAAMPSVLAEIGFLSNRRDEALLKRPDQRQRIAEALFKGIQQYAAGLGQTQAALNVAGEEPVQSTR